MSKDCEWESPWAPAVRLLRDARAVDAVVELLESTRAGRRAGARVLGPREVEGQASSSGDEREEGGPGPLRLYFLLSVSVVLLLSSFFLSFVWRSGKQEIGVP